MERSVGSARVNFSPRNRLAFVYNKTSRSAEASWAEVVIVDRRTILEIRDPRTNEPIKLPENTLKTEAPEPTPMTIIDPKTNKPINFPGQWRKTPYVFQQESAPSHTALKSQYWMARNCLVHVTPNLYPPPNYSPDLNP
ncbi:hypothetical protein ACTXT7_007066 [Hymenolepis weldensis]